MPPEQYVLCGPLREPRCPVEGEPVHLNRWGPHKNVYLDIDDVKRPFYQKLPDIFVDLLDIAAYVYSADQALPRSCSRIVDFDPSWRRNLVFRLPVRVPEFWQNEPAYGQLVSVLSFLTEDEYRFEFEPLTEEHPLDACFTYGGTA